MKRLIILAEAELELAESVGFYERRRSGLGLEFEEAARLAVKAIHHDPMRHSLGRHGTRRFVMERFPFVIHYLDTPETLWVIAFAHTSRKPGYWKKRL